MDLVVAELTRKFNQEDERSSLDQHSQSKKVVSWYKYCYCQIQFKDRLKVDFGFFGDLKERKVFNAVYDIVTYICKQQLQTRFLLRDAEKLAELVLSLPVSRTATERSFSAVKRLNACLRTTKQDRLAYLSFMLIHQYTLDKIDM